MRPKPSSPSAARWAAGRMSTTECALGMEPVELVGLDPPDLRPGRGQEIVGAARRQRTAAAAAAGGRLFHCRVRTPRCRRRTTPRPAPPVGPRSARRTSWRSGPGCRRAGSGRARPTRWSRRGRARRRSPSVAPACNSWRTNDSRPVSSAPRHRFHEDAADHAHRSGGSAVVVELDLPTPGPGDQPGVEVSCAGHQPPGAASRCRALPASARRERGGSPPRRGSTRGRATRGDGRAGRRRDRATGSRRNHPREARG